MIKKQLLQRKLKLLQKKEKDRIDKVKETGEYKELKKTEKNLGKKEDELEGEINEIEENNSLIYLDGDGEPRYSNREGSWNSYERNIREETLNGIKRALGITNLSVLKASEIEKVVQKLIDKKLNSNKEYKEKRIEKDKIEENLENIEEKLEKLNEEEKGFWEKENKLYNELSKIEERERRIKDLKNPEQRKKVMKWRKQDEARQKLKDVDKKLDDIHTEIIKERIITNLEEEEDEDD